MDRVGLVGEREEQDLQQHRDDQDRDAEIAEQVEEEVEHLKERLGDEVEPAPVDQEIEVLDAVPLVIGIDGRDLLGAGKEALVHFGRGTGLKRLRCAGDRGLIGAIGRLALLRGEGTLERLRLVGNDGSGPVLVGDAEEAAGDRVPDLADRIAARDRLLLVEVRVGDLLQALVAENTDHALVQHVIAEGDRAAVAGDEAVGLQGHGRRAAVLDRVLHREHELVVDRDRAAEDQTLLVLPGQGDRAAGSQRSLVGRPHRILVRQAARLRADPAELRVIGVLGAGGRQEHDDRALGIDGLAVVLQGHVVDAAAAQVDGAGDGGSVDGDARRAGEGCLTSLNSWSRRRARNRSRHGGRGATGLARACGRIRCVGIDLRGLRLLRGLPLLFGLGSRKEVLPAQQDRQRQGDGDDEVFVIFTHGNVRDARRWREVRKVWYALPETRFSAW